MHVNEISGSIVDAAMKLHTRLGVGLLESAYEACLAHDLRKRGHVVDVQREVRLVYDDLVVETAYRMDMLVDGQVIVEIKSLPKLLAVHEAQLLTYLRMTGCPVGLLVNFGEPHLKHGIKRFVNRLQDDG